MDLCLVATAKRRKKLLVHIEQSVAGEKQKALCIMDGQEWKEQRQI